MTASRRRLLVAASVFLALLPPARMGWIVLTYGENNLSNDYLGRVGLVGALLDGTWTLGEFIKGAWIAGGHSTISLVSIYWLNARLFAWNVRVELVLGLAVAAATLALIVTALPARIRWPLLPLLSLLLFSTARVTSFTYGESTLQMGLAQLGVAAGAWACVRCADRPVALAAWLAAGGLLASWSWGGGVMAWPVFLLALLALRVRSPLAWTVFAAAAALGLAQYVFLLVLRPVVGEGTSRLQLASAPRTLLELLGRPLSNDVAVNLGPMHSAQLVGILGVLVLVAGLPALAGGLRPVISPVVLLAWSILVAIQIALFRGGVAPWYVSPMTVYWVGAIGLVASTGFALRIPALAVIALLVLRIQPTWEDKSFYLPSRSPASAACLREWKTAPRACRDRVFQWGKVLAGEMEWLGTNLETRRLSVFGPHRTYLLQGDVILGRVAFEPGEAPAFLSRDGRTPGDPNDFHRLDLVMPARASATWRVDLPPNLARAVFVTRTRRNDSTSGHEATASIEILAEDGPLAPALASPPGSKGLSLDLVPHAGRAIAVRFVGDDRGRGTPPVVLEAPRIELEIRPARTRRSDP